MTHIQHLTGELSWIEPIRALAARLGRVVKRIRKTDPLAEERAILRIAETSPHLLRDIGFSEAGGSGSGYFSDGERHISVPRRDPADVVLRSGRF